MIKTLPFSGLSTLLLFFVTVGQEKPNSNKLIALFDNYSFSDSKNGINKLQKAYFYIDQLSCFPNQDTLSRIKELENSSLSSEDRKEKLSQLKKIFEEQSAKREKILVEPVLNEISEALKQLGYQNNVIFLDGAKLEENGQLLAFDRKLDLSDKITKAINDYFTAGIVTNLRPDLSEMKIAVIDGNLFDKFYLTKQLDNKTKEVKEGKSESELATEHNLILNYRKDIQEFANKNRFNLILDSNKRIPVELENFPIQDVTSEFISYLNHKKQ
jgi:hypothetical protein